MRQRLPSLSFSRAKHLSNMRKWTSDIVPKRVRVLQTVSFKVFVGLRGFGIVLVKPNKNAIFSVCHYFRRLLERVTASTEPGTSAIANSDTLDSTLPLMLKRATAMYCPKYR